MALSLGKYKCGATDSVPPASRAVTKRFAFVTLIGKRPMRLEAIPRRIEFLGNWQRLYRVALYQGPMPLLGAYQRRSVWDGQRWFSLRLSDLRYRGPPEAMIGWLALKLATSWNHPDWKHARSERDRIFSFAWRCGLDALCPYRRVPSA